MKIGITSEMDSRVCIYPLIQILSHFGKVAVHSKNRTFSRLIDGGTNGDFCGIRFILDGHEDAVDKDTPVDFDIYDGRIPDDSELILAVIGCAISEDFAYDLQMLVENPALHVLKFGKPVQNPSAKKQAKKGAEETPELARTLTPEQQLIELLTNKKSKWLKILSIEEVENLEALHKWFKCDQQFANEVYRIMGQSLCADQHIYMKEVQKPNEDCVDINPLYVG